MNVREHPLQLTDPPSRQISPYVDIFACGILKLVFKDFRKTESCKPLAASYMVNISCALASLFLGMAFLRAVFAANCYFFGQIYLICFLDAYLRGVQLVECQQEATRREVNSFRCLHIVTISNLADYCEKSIIAISLMGKPFGTKYNV